MKKTNDLYFCQWTICGDEYFKQFKTENLLKVISELENEFNGLLNIETYKTGCIRLDFEYVSVYVTTGMEKLIDCEVL
jgi:hypothetical protein